MGGNEPTEVEQLRIVAERVPDPSGANDFVVIGAAALAAVCGLVFAVGIVLSWPLTVHGGALALGLFAMAVAVRRYFADRFPDVDAIEPRQVPGAPGGSDEQDAGPIAEVGSLERRRFVGRVLAGALGLFSLGLLAPVASLGPAPGDALRRTTWTPGRRLVTTDGDYVSPDDLAVGGILTVWPEGDVGVERSSVLLFRLSATPTEPTNLDWVVDEQVVAYSKVCTHAGCPVALYRERENALFCPCHQSTFDVTRGAVPTFGPAARGLPQLPLGLDDEGLLVALGDFPEQVGPAFG
jgi:ubiquinol-cytochrome c reductase iron-sulfur subunit